MREGTSGFRTTVRFGQITIRYVDYGVSLLGGGDFEKTYSFDKQNSKKLTDALEKEYKGSLDEMLESAFGKEFDDPLFCDFCQKNDVQYTSSTWSD